MATIIKRGGRKLLAVGQPEVGYVNMTKPMLTSREHIGIWLGDYIIRIEREAALQLVKDINSAVRYFDKEIGL